MKGLELCKRFFFEVGLPKIQKEMPEVMPMLSAGLGGGSQCHENDDEVSRDHGWGPGFAVWLKSDIKLRFEQPLQSIFAQLPKEYLGYGWVKEEDAAHACPILDIDHFIKTKVGIEDAPNNDVDWLKISEEKLFEITHFPVFFDSTGEITRRFNAFKQYYPDDVWKKRLLLNLSVLWQWSTQYVKRAAKRNDMISAGLHWGRFAEAAMKVGFLLNREYAPYAKWLYVQFKKLPELGQEISSLIRKGVEQPYEIENLANQIEELYIKKLMFLGFEPKELPNAAYPKQTIQLLEFAQGISNTINNPQLK